MKSIIEKSVTEIKNATNNIESVCPKDGPCKEKYEKLKKDAEDLIPLA